MDGTLRVVVADETGLLKHVHLRSKTEVEKWRSQDRTRCVRTMCFDPADPSQHTAILGLENGDLEKVDLVSGASAVHRAAHCKVFRGLDFAENNIVTCDGDGRVQLFSSRNLEGDPLHTLNTGWRCWRMRTSKTNPDLLIVGGEEFDVSLWSVSKNERLFKSKNVKNDMLNLRVPVRSTDLAFRPGSGDTQFATCSAFHHVRLYDSKVKQRPVINIEHGEYPFTSMCMSPDGNSAIVGDSQGAILSFDLRAGRLVGSFKGNAGSVRSLVCHETLPLIAACGLDRHLRIYDADSRNVVHKIYLKQRLNTLLFARDLEVSADGSLPATPLPASLKIGAEEAEDEKLWGSLAQVKEKRKDSDSLPSKKKRKEAE